MPVETPVKHDALSMFYWLHAWVPTPSNPITYFSSPTPGSTPALISFWKVPDGPEDDMTVGYRVYRPVHMQIRGTDGRRRRGFVGIFNQGGPGVESVEFRSAGDTYRFQRPDYTRSVFMRDLVGLMYRKLHGF
jgi:hypothetical protein